MRLQGTEGPSALASQGERKENLRGALPQPRAAAGLKRLQAESKVREAPYAFTRCGGEAPPQLLQVRPSQGPAPSRDKAREELISSQTTPPPRRCFRKHQLLQAGLSKNLYLTILEAVTYKYNRTDGWTSGSSWTPAITIQEVRTGPAPNQPN